MNETMNLHEYYRNHKDAINASIMDIACDLAVGRLLNAHGAPYDKEYARVAKLMKFDYCQEDGVAASPEDTNT